MPNTGATAKKASGKRPDAFVLLRQEYDLADRTAKKVQRFVSMAGVPAINELRYVAHHLINVVAPADQHVDTDKELQRAINHCKRATYEASEAGILFAFDRIDQFKQDYRRVMISSVVSDWSDILALCSNVTHRLAEAREAGEDKTQDHSDFEQLFERLVAICSRLDEARGEMNKLVQHDRKAARQFLVTVAFSLLGVVVTIGATVATLALQ